jgi:hypothetical protein
MASSFLKNASAAWTTSSASVAVALGTHRTQLSKTFLLEAQALGLGFYHCGFLLIYSYSRYLGGIRKSLGSPLHPSPSEGCGTANREPKEGHLNTAVLSNPDSLHTLISFPSLPSLSSSGLVDSGSSHCFVDPLFMSKHSIHSYEIPPVILCLINSSVGAMITRAAKISTNDILLLKFYVTKLDSPSAFVFSHNWLHRYNPSIDWSAGQIICFQSLLHSVPSSTHMNNSLELPVSTPTFASDPKPSVSLDTSDFKSFEASTLPDSSIPSVSFINAAAYARLARLPGNTIFTVTISNATDSATGSAASVAPVDLSEIPEDYHEYQDVFSKSSTSTLPPHHSYDLKIDLEEGAEPPIGRMYSLSKKEMGALREFLDNNLNNGFIRPSNSSHRAPIIFVKKKDSSLCLCVDFHRLNKISKKDCYPLPLISDLLDSPGKVQIYTKIDLRHAYHLVCIREGDEWKTTFCTKYGSFELLVMPFGLSNAPGTFQRFMNNVFANMLDICVAVYFNNILIYSFDKMTHHKQVKEVLHRLWKHGLYAKPEKCEFDRESVEYLGYILSADRLTIVVDKVQAIQDWPELWKVKDVQSFLGFANFYRCFIYNFSNIVIPLTHLTRKNIPFVFGDKEHSAFVLLKESFVSAPIFTHFIPDHPIIVETDASDYALAAIRSQLENGEIHLVAFHSCSFNLTELNYDVHDKELYAIFEVFRIWWYYLDGSALLIDVVTDHKNFTTTKVLNCYQARWSGYLCQFNLVVQF